MKKSFTDPALLFIHETATPEPGPERSGADQTAGEAAALPESDRQRPGTKKRMQIIVDCSIYEELRRLAFQNHESMNGIINAALLEYLKGENEK